MSYVDLAISDIGRRRPLGVGRVRVSATSMLTWIPAEALDSLGVEPESLVTLERPDGTLTSRWRAGVLLHVADRSTAEDVIFCEPGDEPVLGWHALSGFNLRLDETTGLLVDRGPIPAAAATFSAWREGLRGIVAMA